MGFFSKRKLNKALKERDSLLNTLRNQPDNSATLRLTASQIITYGLSSLNEYASELTNIDSSYGEARAIFLKALHFTQQTTQNVTKPTTYLAILAAARLRDHYQELGSAAYKTDNFDAAQKNFKTALYWARLSEQPGIIAASLYNLSNLESYLGHSEEEQKLLHEALEFVKIGLAEIKDPEIISQLNQLEHRIIEALQTPKATQAPTRLQTEANYLTYDDFAEALLAEAQSPSIVSPEVHAQMKEDILKHLNDMINARTISVMNDKQVYEFNKLLDRHPKPKEIQDFIAEVIPNRPEFIAKVLADFRLKYLGKA